VGVLGVLVTGEDVFAGAAERLPGDGIGDRVTEIPDTGKFFRVAPGEYDVTVHVLDWRTKKEFFDEDGEPLPSAPPDFVVQLAPRAKAFDAPNQLASLLDLVPRAEVKPSLRPSPPVRRPAPEAPRPVRSSSAPVVPPAPEPPAPPAFGPFDYALVKRAFRDVVSAERAIREASGGVASFLLKPRDPSLQAKDVELEDFLGKVTRVRDQMRVFEQKVNASEQLEEEAMVALDAHVTRVYEALAELVALLS
jgi:hypothetical protein